jgi:hypothetical protein
LIRLNLISQSKSVFFSRLYELMFPERRWMASRFLRAAFTRPLGAIMTAWKSISTAPLGQDVELQVGDRFGDHVLSFPCRLTDTGWINAELNVALSPSVMPLVWRPWKERK